MNDIIKEPHKSYGHYFYYGDADDFIDIEDVKGTYDEGSEVVEVNIDYADLCEMDQEELEEAFNQHSYKP
jgi:hypothetical protein